MDLSLTGSQINLATRYKPATPLVQYPTPANSTFHRHSRPPSANSFNSWPNSVPPFKGRPASADVGQLMRNKKLSFRAASDDAKTLNRAPSSSSSNILRLLLSETINRAVGEERIDSPQSMEEAVSQSEEEILDECPEVDEEPVSKPIVFHKQDSSQRKSLKFSPSKKSSGGSNKPPLKFAPGIHSIPNSWLEKSKPHSTSNDKLSEKPDLPGRVSFSSNDVFEIDYSDFSDDSHFNVPDKAQNSKKVVHFQENKQALIVSTSPKKETASKMDYSQTNEFSSKIIEDYKKEIESLNRRHEEEMTKLSSEQNEVLYFNNNNMVLPGKDAVDAVQNSVIDTYLETIKEGDHYESISPLDTEIVEEDLDEASEAPTPKDIKLQRTPTSTWDNSQRSDQKVCSSSSDEKLDHDEEGEGEEQVIKEKELKPPVTFNVKKNLVQKPSQSNAKSSFRKPKIPQNTRFNPIKPQALQPEQKLRKSKSVSSLKEENQLRDFQMDKIDSWMSIHNKEKEVDSMRTLMLMKRPQSSHVGYNKEWRDTPSSKTDDEGNFSLEEANDCYSNESTTYDELVSIIKEIEADKKKTDERKSLQADVEFKLKSELSDNDAPEPACDPVKKILNFLDDVESNCDRAIQRVHTLDSDRDDFQFAVEPDVMGTVPKMEDLLMLPNRHLARRVIAMYLRTNELSNACQLAKENMKSVREEKIKAVRTEKLNAQKSLADQKRHFENIVSRHQAFVEQLLTDKSSLCEKVTGLTRRVESQNQAWEHKLETEVNRTRETILASEKIRRERWTKENTKKIKELTVKGLEQEINRMTEKHKQEIADVKRQHQQEMHERLDEARAKYEHMEKGVRETCAEDRESVIEKERNAIRERYERQMITEQHSFEEQKVRMALEWNSERERLIGEIKSKEREFESKKDSLVAERNDQLEQLRADHREKCKQLTEHHRSEINSIRDQFEKDFVIWKSEFESAQKLREIERENNIRTDCRKERDAQIDDIVAKIDSEALRHQQDYDLKLRRMRDKFEIDLKELEVAESRSREKYLETRHRLAECDGAMQNMNTTIKKLEIELGHSKKLCNEFIIEKDTIHEKARMEIRAEMDAKRKEHEEEIQRIYSRVQKAIQKKDATLEVLQGDNNILKERCLKLEAIIRQQRKDYCTK